VLQERAELVMNVVSRFGTRRDREILETCVMLRSWRQSETIWPGRSWQSVQDDFRSIADRLYQKEHRMLMETSELIAEVARRAAEQQSRRRA
jgi:hypothetical protein